MATNRRKSEIKIVDLSQSSGGGVTPSQMSEAILNAVGKGLEVGFDGTLKDNVLTFVPPESSGTYDLKEDYDYIVDLSFPAVGDLDDSVEMEIENDGEMIQFFTITHTNVTTSATVADLKDVMKYDEATGYRWVFRARCHITSSSSIKCFVILPTVQPANSGGGVTEEELNSAIETHNTSTLSHEDIREKIENLELYKTPNAIIIGDPTINNGQVSDFSIENYLQFPSVVDLTDKDFEIDFSFTTDTGVQTQQNILDSKFGIAIAIGSARMILAMSSNGTSWDIANAEMGSYIIEPETTYYCKLTRSVENQAYELFITKDPSGTYEEDIYVLSDGNPYPRTMYIGGASQSAIGHTPTPFYGSINLNKAKLIIDGIEVWQGMDDVGLATRATKSLSNIDSDGVQKIIDSVPIATTSTLGKVKPDGTTITITDDGTITSAGGSGTVQTVNSVSPTDGNVDVTEIKPTSGLTCNNYNYYVDSSADNLLECNGRYYVKNNEKPAFMCYTIVNYSGTNYNSVVLVSNDFTATYQHCTAGGASQYSEMAAFDYNGTRWYATQPDWLHDSTFTPTGGIAYNQAKLSGTYSTLELAAKALLDYIDGTYSDTVYQFYTKDETKSLIENTAVLTVNSTEPTDGNVNIYNILPTSHKGLNCTDEDYIISEGGTTLSSIGDRNYKKTNDGECFAFCTIVDGWYYDILISNVDSYTDCYTEGYSDSYPAISLDTVEYGGTTWYSKRTNANMTTSFTRTGTSKMYTTSLTSISSAIVTEFLTAQNCSYSEEAIYQFYTKDDVTTKLASKLNKQQISNCILEDPQNIKLELSDGTLTLKAGSVVCIPNGFEDDGTTPKFDEVEITEDVSNASTASDTSIRFVFYNKSSNAVNFRYYTGVVSGDEPTGTINYFWYDTTTNLVKYGNKTSGWADGGNISLPIAIIHSTTSSTFNIIDQTFQSIGYIGSTVFVKKGLKVAIPNGRNDDGSLNNIETSTTSTLTLTTTGRNSNDLFELNYSEDTGLNLAIGNNNSLYYDAGTNYYRAMSDNTTRQRFIIATATTTDSVISNFQPKTALTINNLSDGQWVGKQATLLSSVALPSSSTTYSLPSDYLPNDGYNYEVIFDALVTTGTTSGNYARLFVGSDVLGYTPYVCNARTRTSSSIDTCGTITIPIGTSRTFIVGGSSSTGTINTLRVSGYRRIGTNS